MFIKIVSFCICVSVEGAPIIYFNLAISDVSDVSGRSLVVIAALVSIASPTIGVKTNH